MSPKATSLKSPTVKYQQVNGVSANPLRVSAENLPPYSKNTTTILPEDKENKTNTQVANTLVSESTIVSESDAVTENITATEPDRPFEVIQVNKPDLSLMAIDTQVTETETFFTPEEAVDATTTPVVETVPTETVVIALFGYLSK